MATFDEILSGGGVTAVSGVDSIQGIETLIPKKLIPEVDGGSDSGFTFSTPTKEESEATLTEGMTDVGENKGIGSLGSMAIGAILSAINPVLGMAYSLSDPNSITRQVLSKIGFNPTTEGSINGSFGGYNGFDGTEGTFSTDSSDTGASGGFDSAAEDSDQSGGDAGSTSGTDSAGDGGDGYATGGRVGYADGSNRDPANLPNLMLYSNFLDYLRGRTEGTYNDAGAYIPYYNYYNEITPDTSLFGKYKNSTIPENVSELYDQYLDQARQFMYSPDLENYKVQGELSDGTWYTSYRMPSSTANQTPTEDTSSNLAAGLYQTTNPNIIGYSPSEPAITALPQAQETNKTLAETLFPQGDFLNIRETATSPTQYNIEATKDLVQNLPAVIQPFAPAVAGVMSLPYDAIQAYQRMQPGSGISGFAKAYAAERPLQSAYERFVGASGPLAENINKAVSNLNPFQQQQYMQYAANNPEQAREAAQRNQDFVQATQRTQQARGGRIGYLQGGLSSLLGNYYG